MDWEDELRSALARKEPAAGFAERVAAAAARERRVVLFPAPRWAVAAAATVVLALGGGFAWRQHRGEAAKREVMTAMRITAIKLNQVQMHVLEARQ